ncbi:MAG TPA: TetR/AcrR family transcriptional regulator [Vicinamibacterales bacterium]|nr:TetR/AcrR family transcriptional regulator [Vicinamibacterales bacterium]
MTIHSVAVRATSTNRRLTIVRAAPAGEKRDLILRAATKVFAQNGYFQSQVADVARVAGVAAGTVYLYFKSKDDLLVSIFERSMNEVLADGKAAVAGIDDPAERLSKLAHLHLERLGRDKDLAVVFQVELRQSVKFMERFSETFLQDYFKLIRQAIADGQQSGAFRKDISATTATKIFFGALDEMATNWVLSRRKYDLNAEADAVVNLFIHGVKRR